MNTQYFLRKIKEKNLSQKDIARKLDVNPSIVSQWVNGIKNPRVSTLIELCKLLNMDANILLNLKGEFDE